MTFFSIAQQRVNMPITIPSCSRGSIPSCLAPLVSICFSFNRSAPHLSYTWDDVYVSPSHGYNRVKRIKTVTQITYNIVYNILYSLYSDIYGVEININYISCALKLILLILEFSTILQQDYGIVHDLVKKYNNIITPSRFISDKMLYYMYHTGII